jgi:ribosomal protein L11 methyltransferase
MPYHQLVLELPAGDLARAEEACTRLGALAVSLADAGDEPLLEPAPGDTPLWATVRLRALFAQSANPELAAATLAVVLGLPPAAIEIERLEDRVWEREWLKDFRPMRFGRRLWVAPAGQRPDGPAPVIVELDPGLAFGTGTHATTALCLEWLDGNVRGGERILDYGCGSGILAIAALKLGAACAVACDIDPQALTATRANAARNGLAGSIEIAPSPGEVVGRFGIVLANILAGPLVELASRLGALTDPGGAIVLAGLLEPQSGEVAGAYRPWFDIAPAAERDGWALLAGRRRAE